MKTYEYTVMDVALGIPLTISGELVESNAIDEPPYIIIQEISYDGKELEPWCLSDAFMRHCENRIFSEWCNEANRSMV